MDCLWLISFTKSYTCTTNPPCVSLLVGIHQLSWGPMIDSNTDIFACTEVMHQQLYIELNLAKTTLMLYSECFILL